MGRSKRRHRIYKVGRADILVDQLQWWAQFGVVSVVLAFVLVRLEATMCQVRDAVDAMREAIATCPKK